MSVLHPRHANVGTGTDPGSMFHLTYNNISVWSVRFGATPLTLLLYTSVAGSRVSVLHSQHLQRCFGGLFQMYPTDS